MLIWPNTDKSNKIWPNLPRNQVLACLSEPACPIFTKIGTLKQRDPGNKRVTAFFQMCKFDPTRRGQISRFDLISRRNHVLVCHSDRSCPMWTKIVTKKQLDPESKPVTYFFLKICKFCLARRRLRSKFDLIWPKITFSLVVWIWQVRCAQNRHNQATWPYKQSCKSVLEYF